VFAENAFQELKDSGAKEIITCNTIPIVIILTLAIYWLFNQDNSAAIATTAYKDHLN
jgi:phosphoribosylpyrophosphate synthetase